MDINGPNQYTRLTTTGVVKAGSGNLVGFFVASGTPTVKLWDNASAASGTVILNTSAAVVPPAWYPLPLAFTKGCYATITGAGDITFVYQ